MKCSCKVKTTRTYVFSDDTIIELCCYYCGSVCDSVSIPRTEEAFRAIKEATQYLAEETEE
jgi:hypothetical protein